MEEQTVELYRCVCGAPYHQLIVDHHEWQYIGEDGVSSGDKTHEYILTMHLADVPLFQRLRYAWDYIRGKRNGYGAFEEVILSEEQAHKLGRRLLFTHSHKQ